MARANRRPQPIYGPSDAHFQAGLTRTGAQRAAYLGFPGAPPHIIAAPRHAVGVGHVGRSILGEKYRPVQIDDITELAEHERGSHRQTGTDHVTHHDLQSKTARLACHRETLRQAAALIQLDVDHFEAALEGGEVGHSKRAFIRGDRDTGCETLEIGFAAALRRSELAALRVPDLEMHEEGILLHIRRSKTDQEGEGAQIPIPRGGRLGLDPPTSSEAVHAVLRGIRRRIGVAPVRKAPATARAIGAMLDQGVWYDMTMLSG